ncbi:MAG: hypothetical protein HKN08_13035, partial [Gammaproteobacteria bacterium]|nr:hypothetical protein [Gammaproteobacteria bacterium]
MKARFYWALLNIAFLCLISSVVHSHPLSVSYAEFTVRDQAFSATYRLPMDDMDLLLGLDTDLDETISDTEISEASAGLNNYIQEHVTVQLNDSVTRHTIIGM